LNVVFLNNFLIFKKRKARKNFLIPTKKVFQEKILKIIKLEFIYKI